MHSLVILRPLPTTEFLTAALSQPTSRGGGGGGDRCWIQVGRALRPPTPPAPVSLGASGNFFSPLAPKRTKRRRGSAPFEQIPPLPEAFPPLPLPATGATTCLVQPRPSTSTQTPTIRTRPHAHTQTSLPASQSREVQTPRARTRETQTHEPCTTHAYTQSLTHHTKHTNTPARSPVAGAHAQTHTHAHTQSRATQSYEPQLLHKSTQSSFEIPLHSHSSTCGAVSCTSKFDTLAAQDGENTSTYRYHTITKLEPFKQFSIEQYHWLEYEAKIKGEPSLWQNEFRIPGTLFNSSTQTQLAAPSEAKLPLPPPPPPHGPQATWQARRAHRRPRWRSGAGSASPATAWLQRAVGPATTAGRLGRPTRWWHPGPDGPGMPSPSGHAATGGGGGNPSPRQSPKWCGPPPRDRRRPPPRASPHFPPPQNRIR